MFDPNADELIAVLAAAERNDTRRVGGSAADYELGTSFDPAMVRAEAASPRLRGWVFGRAEHLDAKAVQRFLNERLAEIAPHERISGVADLAFAGCATLFRKGRTNPSMDHGG